MSGDVWFGRDWTIFACRRHEDQVHGGLVFKEMCMAHKKRLVRRFDERGAFFCLVALSGSGGI